MPWTFFNSSGEALTSFGPVALTDLDIDGGTDIGEAIVDADLFIIDNGAGGTNVKTAASRIITYVGANTDTRSGVAKVWWHIAASGALSSPDYGVSTVGDTSAGLRAINFTTPFSSAVYAISSSIAAGSMELQAWFDTFATGSVRHGISLSISGYTATDTITTGSIHGDQ